MARALALVLLLAVTALLWLPQSTVQAQQRLDPNAAAAAAANDRDSELRRLASERAAAGDWIASLRTLAAVADRRQFAQGLDQVQSVLNERYRSGQDAGDDTGSAVPAPAGRDGGGRDGGGRDGGGRGGASFADFNPLIDLIQNAIEPDTWELAGGAGTLRPYPAGILVDSSGLVTEITAAKPEDDQLANIALLLADQQRPESTAAPAAVQAWRLPARHRCVSLRGVAGQVVRRRLQGATIDDELRHLAGLSRVEYLVLLPRRRDVIMIGPVGGIQSHQGWLRDRRSGLPAMRLDFLTACATAVVTGQPLGCSIDPTPASLAAAAETGAAIRSGEIPLGMAEEALRQALGEQSIRVFGVAGDAPLAYLMVQADWHMKRLSLGLEPMPRGVLNYLDLVDQHIARGPPDGQLLRLWFTSAAMDVRVCSASRVYQLSGRPMQLACETQLAGLAGDRLPSQQDIRLVEFVAGFNQHLDEIIADYPAYGALQSVYAAAGIAEVLRRSDGQRWIAELLAPLLLDDAAGGSMAVPKRVQSITKAHWVKHRGKRHFTVLASGGVRVEPAQTVKPHFHSYPAIDAVAGLAQPPIDSPQRWWWDAK